MKQGTNMWTNNSALSVSSQLRNMVQTYPQTSEDEPAGYVSQCDETIDDAADHIIWLVDKNKENHAALIYLRSVFNGLRAIGGVACWTPDSLQSVIDAVKFIDEKLKQS